MIRQVVFLALIVGSFVISCQSTSDRESKTQDSTHSKITNISISGLEIYQSENLAINKISSHTYQHISYLDTESFGKVACNGMVVVNGGEAVVFDTPTDDRASRELIDYLTQELHCRVMGVVATHFHADCVGGIKVFHQKEIPTYASRRTIDLLRAKASPLPQNGFESTLSLDVGDQKVRVEFLGEGHTEDNVVGYFPTDKVMFGGCLIKEIGAGKGNLEDANVPAWPETVRNIKAKYPQIMVVIPGHGKAGGQELFDFTEQLFEK